MICTEMYPLHFFGASGYLCAMFVHRKVNRAVCEERKTVKRLLVAGHGHFSQT